MKMQDRVAVVTGAGQGMGKEIAKTLASLGATVVIAEICRATGEEAVRSIQATGGQAIYRQLDVRDTRSVQDVAQWMRQTYGRLDIAVNNAGIVKNAPTLETSDDDWIEVIEVNLNGVFRCCREFGRMMVEQGQGAIVNMSSNSAVIVDRPQVQPAYNASKAGVAQLTKSLAAEWAPHRVRVNAIAPGYIDTALKRDGQGTRGLDPPVDGHDSDAALRAAGRSCPACRVPDLRCCQLHHRGRVPDRRRLQRLVMPQRRFNIQYLRMRMAKRVRLRQRKYVYDRSGPPPTADLFHRRWFGCDVPGADLRLQILRLS
jgi:NAD(P)-dependent dehydrogenase (short-subunit alcohol dehydrogenase family)